MRLTQPQPLSQSSSLDADLDDITAIRHSTFFTSNIYIFRFDKVSSADILAWLQESTRHLFKSALEEPSMSRLFPLPNEGDFVPTSFPSTKAYERLVVRDLDLSRSSTAIQADATADTNGTVISYAVYSFLPSGPTRTVFSQFQKSLPKGSNEPLCMKWASLLDNTTYNTFKDLPCFYFNAMFTLTPSHLRKGAAAELVNWIMPYSDLYGLPVVVIGSPLGVKVYKKAGFEEVCDLTIDLGDWGWEEREQAGKVIEEGDGKMHRHLVLVRWPQDLDKLDVKWKQWRRDRGME